MNIIMTGFTQLQVDRSKRGIQKINVPRIMAENLQLLGHEVKWAPAFELIDEMCVWADALFINVAGCCSLNAPFSISALWAIGKAKERGIPVVMHFDDWQTRGTISHARTFLKKGTEQLFKQLRSGNNMGYLYHDDDVKLVSDRPAFQDNVFAGCRALGFEFSSWEQAIILCPMYKFGDLELVAQRCFPRDTDPPKVEKMAKFDPSGCIGIRPDLNESRFHASQKQKRWILAALMPHDVWLKKVNLGWPVQLYGSRKLKAPRLKTEFDIQEQTALSWGVLSPPYHQAGSGWFRSRYLYAALTKSVLYADEKDCAPLGDAYTYVPRNIRAVENADSHRLWQIAHEQSTSFLGKIAITKSETLQQIASLMGRVEALRGS